MKLRQKLEVWYTLVSVGNRRCRRCSQGQSLKNCSIVTYSILEYSVNQDLCKGNSNNNLLKLVLLLFTFYRWETKPQKHVIGQELIVAEGDSDLGLYFCIPPCFILQPTMYPLEKNQRFAFLNYISEAKTNVPKNGHSKKRHVWMSLCVFCLNVCLCTMCV